MRISISYKMNYSNWLGLHGDADKTKMLLYRICLEGFCVKYIIYTCACLYPRENGERGKFSFVDMGLLIYKYSCLYTSFFFLFSVRVLMYRMAVKQVFYSLFISLRINWKFPIQLGKYIVNLYTRNTHRYSRLIHFHFFLIHLKSGVVGVFLYDFIILEIL